jgi:hypothetical protein
VKTRHPELRIALLTIPALMLLAGCSTRSDVYVLDRSVEVPEWALLQRELLEANAEGARVFAGEFLDDRGYLTHVTRWGGNDGPDDAMENFHNWTLAYALGSPRSVLDEFSRAWEGHILQYTEARAPGIPMAEEGMFHREFITSFDWEHTGEGLAAFHFYGLGEPNDPRYRERVVRFAGFYNGDDPEAQNYDRQHRIIRSLHNGSRGPKLTPATEMDWGGLPEPDDPDRLTRYATASNIVGDHPLNLLATTLGMNAYMLTGEDRYRNWVLEYTGAWRDRILTNGGNIPTNIGLDGTIGGEWDGKWYGGVFGWNFDASTSSRNYFSRGVRVGMGNAILLTGDRSWAEPLRQQMNNLFAVQRVDEQGRILLPNKHGDDGWWGYIPNRHSGILRDLYLWTLDDADRERVRDQPWVAFLAGENPEYPAVAFRNELQRVAQRIEQIRSDPATPEDRWARWRSDSFFRYNPVATTALINLTLGGNDPDYVGNTLHSQVRYFDPQLRRAGLPRDVAALVTAIRPQGIALTLVNTSATEAREVLVQGGAYGEHDFTTVAFDGRTETPARSTFSVRLEPGAGADLQIGMRRYANQPTLHFPWDRTR